MNKQKRTTNRVHRSKTGHDGIRASDDSITYKLLAEISPSPENDKLYRPVDLNDPTVRELAESIRKEGLKEPLVISLDGFIVSGHRRHFACKRAGMIAVPCRIEPIRRTDDLDAFVRLLATHNKQRVKSFDETMR